MSSQVKPERTGWRDQALSLRHRKWGWDCPCIDIDFLLLEYDCGEPKALVEYKHEDADAQTSGHPSYRALRKLANSASIPFFAVRYAGDFEWFRAVPLNVYARNWMDEPSEMSEQEWVTLLYRMGDREVPADIFEEPFYVV